MGNFLHRCVTACSMKQYEQATERIPEVLTAEDQELEQLRGFLTGVGGDSATPSTQGTREYKILISTLPRSRSSRQEILLGKRIVGESCSNVTTEEIITAEELRADRARLPETSCYAVSVDSNKLMEEFLKILMYPRIDEQRPNPDSSIVVPVKFAAKRRNYITNNDRELPDLPTLRRRITRAGVKILNCGMPAFFDRLMESPFGDCVPAKGLGITTAGVEILNFAMRAFFHRLMESRFGDDARAMMILPVNMVRYEDVPIWLHPCIIPELEKMPRHTTEFDMKEKPRVLIVTTHLSGRSDTISWFKRNFRCKVNSADSGVVLPTLEIESEPRRGVLPIKKLRLVCAEYDMTPVSGLELLAKMKQSSKWRDVPFVMVSNTTDYTRINECLEAGAIMFIMMEELDPDHMAKLKDLLEKVLY